MSDNEDQQFDDPQDEEPQQNQYEEEQEQEQEQQYQQQAEEKVIEQIEENVQFNDELSGEECWKTLSRDNPPFNWYLMTVDNKQSLTYVSRGSGGLKEVSNFLRAKKTELFFGLLRVNSLDEGGSKRAKFIYMRFVGTEVPVMKKAKVTPSLGKIGEQFPVKHLSLDLNEDLSHFDVESLSKEFLRVGGAHKPDKYEYGPNQMYDIKK